MHLLNSLSYLVHEIGFSGFELHVFGRGPLERKVRELVSRFNLNDNIRPREFVEYEELIASMANSDIVCSPSLYEACPVGMIEATSLGKPILALKTAFSRELLGDDCKLPLATCIHDYARCLHLLCTSEGLRNDCQAYLQARARDRLT